MAKRKFIEVTLGNYTILHGYDDQNKEIKEFKSVEKPTSKVLATNTIISVDEQYIVTSHIMNKLCYWEYKNSYEEIKTELYKQTVRPY